jgi:hypothetical protein
MEIGDKVKVSDKYDMNFRQKGVIESFDDQPNGDGILAIKVKFKWVSVWYYPNQLKTLR